DVTYRIDDILAVGPNAIPSQQATLGTIRASGGAYENPSLALYVFRADGLLSRWEAFDVDDHVNALARFDELTAATPRPARRVRPNAATGYLARIDALLAAGDIEAADALGRNAEIIDHPNRITYDKTGSRATTLSLLKARYLSYRAEPLATLGDSLALARVSLAAGQIETGRFDVGPYEREVITAVEVDSAQRNTRTEVFAVEQLGEAISRLYERYAELLPEGPERARAALIARSVPAAALMREPPARWPIAAEIEATDHRTVGFGSARGAESLLGSMHAMFELVERGTFSWHLDDALGVHSDAILLRWTNTGTQRATGGPFERRMDILTQLDVDGRLIRWEQFDVEQENEAPARCDELAAAPAPRPARRVPENAATAYLARVHAAFAADDLGALSSMIADGLAGIDHTTGSTFDAQGLIATFRSMMAARDSVRTRENLAALGDRLVLSRLLFSAAGYAGRTPHGGPDEREAIHLTEVDGQGRCSGIEYFAPDHLGDAVVRLYERYAELLPEGAARTRASAVARSFGALSGRIDLARYSSALAPDVELADHRILGTSAVSGAEDAVRDFRSWLELTDELVTHDDEILDLRADAVVVQRRFLGIARDGGGGFERASLALLLFGGDGLVSRRAVFDPDREADALARVDH